MPESVDQALIGRVLAGDEASREVLFRLVQQRVRAYLNRVTLDREQAADWTQDTIVSVLQALGSLRDTNRFWSWVFTIATNKARQQGRRQARHGTTPMSVLRDTEFPVLASSADEASGRMSRDELAELTRQAMARLEKRHRTVLALRFYEDLPHSEIARVLGCSEMGARAVFFRAKRAMTRELRQLGVAKGALAVALAAFGEATLSPTASAGTVTVSTTAIAESAIATLAPVKVRVGAAAAVLLLIVGGLYLTRTGGSSTPVATPAVSMHFIEQSMLGNSDPVEFAGTRSKGAYEQWFKFPQGVHGPMMLRMQRWDPRQKSKLCWWVQNEDANYYVHAGRREIYIQNERLHRGSLETRLLPTDPEPFCAFVRKMDGIGLSQGIQTSRDPNTGFMSSRMDSRFPGLGPFETVYDYSPVSDDLFGAPTGMPVHDERDAMHRRGWTYFRIQGTLAGRAIEGKGQLPFVYSTMKSHSPWLVINLGGQPAAIDTEKGAFLLAGGQEGQSPAAGSLFRGMSRPWLGLHTIDTIRRDAARERLRYEMNVHQDKQHVEITVIDDRSKIWFMAVFSVRLERDLLEQVSFRRARPGVFDEPVGEFAITYLDSVDGADEFQPPDSLPAGKPGPEPGVLWPLRLLKDRYPTQLAQTTAPADKN